MLSWLRSKPRAEAAREVVVREVATKVPAVARPSPLARSRRAYQAAQADRIAGGFNLFPQSGREELRRDLRALTGHARHGAQNFDYAANYERLFRRHVTGPDGIRLKMDVRDPTGAKDLRANTIIEAGWRAWCRPTVPCVNKRLSWWGVELQAGTALAREGTFLLRLHRNRAWNTWAFAVEPVPFDLLDLDHTVALEDGAYIEGGIECDRWGAPRAVHLWSAPADAGHIGSRNRRRIRVPASDMVVLTVPTEVAGLHGVPQTATALRTFNLLQRFSGSALTAANYGAAAMAFLEREDAGSHVPGASDEGFDSGVDAIEAGTVVDLPPGVKLSQWQGRYPDAAVEPFLRSFQTQAAAGLGVASETLTGDLSRANFSSLRAGKGEERDEWRMLQRAVYESLHMRVFGEWLAMALAVGALGPLPLRKLEKFHADTWQPRGWPSVNPKDDAAADDLNLRNGLTTRREIAAKRGRDWDDVVEELADEREAMSAAGLQAAPAASPPQGTPPAQSQSEDEQ